MTDELDPERLRRLLESVAALPRSIEPARDAWPAIRDRIEAQRVRAIAPHGVGPMTARPRRIVWIAAAAVVLIALSSGVTVLVFRSRTTAQVVSAKPVSQPVAPDSGRTPIAPLAPGPRIVPAAGASIGLVFARYDAAAADLATELDVRRSKLDPRTVAVLDSCIRRIDAAIAEARDALRQDPRNAVVAELLTVSYRQKLDLLKRAADLPLAILQD
jgi:hypothetical protein